MVCNENYAAGSDWSIIPSSAIKRNKYKFHCDFYFKEIRNDDTLSLISIDPTLTSSLQADIFRDLIETGEPTSGAYLHEGTRFMLSQDLRSHGDPWSAWPIIGCATVDWVLGQGGTHIQAIVDFASFPNMPTMFARSRPLELQQELL